MRQPKKRADSITTSTFLLLNAAMAPNPMDALAVESIEHNLAVDVAELAELKKESKKDKEHVEENSVSVKKSIEDTDALNDSIRPNLFNVLFQGINFVIPINNQ